MAGDEGKVSGIKKFDGTDFGYWKMQIEDYLYGRNYIFLFWEGNQIIWKKKNGVFLIDKC